MGERATEASAVPRADVLCTAQGDSFLGCPAEPGPDIHQEGLLGDSLGEKTPTVHLPHGAETLDAHMSVLHWDLYLHKGCPPTPKTPHSLVGTPSSPLCPLLHPQLLPIPIPSSLPPHTHLFPFGGGSAHTMGQGDPRSGSPEMPNAPRAAWGALSLLSPLPPHRTSVSVPSLSFQPHPPALQPAPGGGPATPKQLQSGSNHRASLGSHSRALEGGKNSPGAGKERGGCRAHWIGPLRGQDCDPDPPSLPQKKKPWGRGGGSQQHGWGNTHTQRQEEATCFR